MSVTPRCRPRSPSTRDVEIINKLDGIFNQRYPVYHLKDDVVQFTNSIANIIRESRGSSIAPRKPEENLKIGNSPLTKTHTNSVADITLTNVKSRTDVKPSAQKPVNSKSVEKITIKQHTYIKPKLPQVTTTPNRESPLPTFENQDDVNFYIAKLLSENEALKLEIATNQIQSVAAQSVTLESKSFDSKLKDTSTEVAKLRVQIGEWQKEMIKKEKESKETQSKWLKQIQGNLLEFFILTTYLNVL